MFKQKSARVLACSAMLLLFSNAASAQCSGLTPGFWFNNIDKHKGGALPKGLVGSSLLMGSGFEGFTALNGGTTTIAEALGSDGGGESALMRHATAAYLNAMHPLVFYPITAAQVSAATNDSLRLDDPVTTEILKDQLDEYNNLGCAMNHKGELSYD